MPPRRASIYSPSLCVVAQGRKIAWLGHWRFVYDPLHCLAVSAPLYTQAEIQHASASYPFLSLAMPLEPADIGQMVFEMEDA